MKQIRVSRFERSRIQQLIKFSRFSFDRLFRADDRGTDGRWSSPSPWWGWKYLKWRKCEDFNCRRKNYQIDHYLIDKFVSNIMVFIHMLNGRYVGIDATQKYEDPNRWRWANSGKSMQIQSNIWVTMFIIITWMTKLVVLKQVKVDALSRVVGVRSNPSWVPIDLGVMIMIMDDG